MLKAFRATIVLALIPALVQEAAFSAICPTGLLVGCTSQSTPFGSQALTATGFAQPRPFVHSRQYLGLLATAILLAVPNRSFAQSAGEPTPTDKVSVFALNNTYFDAG